MLLYKYNYTYFTEYYFLEIYMAEILEQQNIIEEPEAQYHLFSGNKHIVQNTSKF